VGIIQKLKLDIKVGQKVRVTAGPFANQVGKIDSIDSDKEVLSVLVEMFGRETPAELTFDEIDADI